MAAWQEVWFVAANPGGTLRRLSMAGPAIFGRFWQEVPEVSQAFLAHAVDRGTLPQYVVRRAKAVYSLSLVVGEEHDTVYDPDRLYVFLTLLPEPHTFKVVVSGGGITTTGGMMIERRYDRPHGRSYHVRWTAHRS
jgi:hypothetical protein